jgi:hypothetical protein
MEFPHSAAMMTAGEASRTSTSKHRRWIIVGEVLLWTAWATLTFGLVPLRASRAGNEMREYYSSRSDTTLTAADRFIRGLQEAAGASAGVENAASVWLIAALCGLTLASSLHVAHRLRLRARDFHGGQVVLLWVVAVLTVTLSRAVFNWMTNEGLLDDLRFRLVMLILSINFAVPIGVFVVVLGLTWYWFGARRAG